MIMTRVFVGKWENINLPSLQENMYLPCKWERSHFSVCCNWNKILCL